MPDAMTMGTTYPAIVGGVLSQMRTHQGLRQEEVAQAVGVSQGTWSRIEKGQTGLTVEHLRAVADVLGIAPGQILTFSDQTEIDITARGGVVMKNRDATNRDAAIAIIASVTLLAIITVIIANTQKN